MYILIFNLNVFDLYHMSVHPLKGPLIFALKYVLSWFH